MTIELVYEAVNELIGLEPFKTTALERTDTKVGFTVAKQKTELTPLQVICGTDKIPAGATAYVMGDLCASADAKRIYEIDGKKMILVNVREVKVVRKWPT